MAHFAIQIANIAVELEDEDMDATELVKLGEAVLSNALTFLVDDDEEDDEDGE